MSNYKKRRPATVYESEIRIKFLEEQLKKNRVHLHIARNKSLQVLEYIRELNANFLEEDSTLSEEDFLAISFRCIDLDATWREREIEIAALIESLESILVQEYEDLLDIVFERTVRRQGRWN